VTINQKAKQVLADINPINYATQRNYLGGGTQLSIYITPLDRRYSRDDVIKLFKKEQK
jgi:hypothetical protein